MYRFFVDNKVDNKFELSKEILNHLKVIRLKKDEKFYCVFEGEFYICHLDGSFAIIDEKTTINNEYNQNIVLFAALIDIKRFEWMIQKATELGVKKIYPLITHNINNKLISSYESKIDRFKEIVKNASEQSFRNIIVDIEKPIKFEEAIKFNIQNKFIAHEKKNSNDSSILFDSDVAFFIGPEGGFTDQEIELAKTNGVSVISLGKKILRAETASIFLLSRIKY